MGVTRSQVLREPAELGARRVALGLLAKVRDARDRLDDPNDRDVLHDFRVTLRRLRSWLRACRPNLRDTLRSKTERRLEQIADVTGTSRDLEVHIAWAKQARRGMSERGRPGAAWLIRRLRDMKRDSDAELREVIDRHFAKAIRQTENALEQYVARVADDGPRFGETAADLVARESAEFQAAMHQVTAQGDRAEAHAARIATKRLRYALEGIASIGLDVDSITDELKDLQDALGELHDAQQFGSELATMMSSLLASRDDGQRDDGAARSPRSPRSAKRDPIAGIRTMLRQLRRTETKAFRAFEKTWKAEDWSKAFGARLAAIEQELR